MQPLAALFRRTAESGESILEPVVVLALLSYSTNLVVQGLAAVVMRGADNHVQEVSPADLTIVDPEAQAAFHRAVDALRLVDPRQAAEFAGQWPK
jgi:hypothetical protein